MYKKNLILIALLAMSANLFSQTLRCVRIMYVDPSSSLIAVKNFLDVDSNLGAWRVASNGVDTPLSKLTVILGVLNPVKNLQIVVLQGLSMNKVKGSVTLYKPNMPLDTSGLHDFMQWGDSDQVNEAAAVSKGIWRKGRYIKDNPPFNFKGFYTEYDDTTWQGVLPPIIIIRFAYVNPSQNRFCIKNAGVSNIDMQYAGICIGNTCLDSMTDPHLSIVRGNMNVLKNDSIVFQLMGMDLDTVKGSMALFAVNKFNKDTTNLLDYVSWGDSMQTYSGLAHLKGIWDSTTTVHLNTAKDSIVYTGDFTRMQTGAQWWQSRTPVYVPGVGISGGCFPGGEVSIYPNPASKSFSIRNEYGKGQATLLDVRGRLLKNIVLNQAEQTVGIDGLSQGIYMLQLTFDSGESRVVKLVIQE